MMECNFMNKVKIFVGGIFDKSYMPTAVIVCLGTPWSTQLVRDVASLTCLVDMSRVSKYARV